MRPRFMLNIGKGYAANADTVKYIISADAERAKRILTKHGFDRNSLEVLDASADGETRSLIMHHDGTMAISSISKSSLIKRFNGEEQPKELD